MRFAITAGLLACAFMFPSATLAQAGKRTIDGDWAINFTIPMETPAGATALVVPEAEAKVLAAKVGAALAAEFAADLDPELPMLVEHSDGLPIVRGQRRSRVVIQPADGILPYTPEARKSLSDPPPPGSYDNPEQRPNAERCLVGSGQAPLVNFSLDSQIQIVATADHVAIHSEYGDDVRIIALNKPHAPKALWSRLGSSIGHWEGETLVVETIGMPDSDRVRLAPTLLVSGDAKVVERFTPISDREMLYQFTVVDPKTFSGPWLAEFSWFRARTPIYEHACHEGNYSLRNILLGARQQEEDAKAGGAAR